MRLAVTLFLLAAAIGLPRPSRSDEIPSVPTGTRIRVATEEHSGKRIVGTLSAADESALAIETSRGPVKVPRERIHALERSERRGWKRRGALIGAGVGLAAAAVLGATSKDDLLSRGEVFLGGLILFVPSGAGLGALLAPGERWTTVFPAPGPTTDPKRAHRGLRAAICLRF